jgi:hypothetical protein
MIVASAAVVAAFDPKRSTDNARNLVNFNNLLNAAREIHRLRIHHRSKTMKNLFLASLATGAICAFVSAAPVAAQETITGAPAGQAPITAEPPGNPGYSNVQIPFLREADRTQGRTDNPGCTVLQGSRAEGGHGELTAVCPFIP